MPQGRPIDPKSERSRKPWDKLGMSRASFYWRKRYGDLPPIPARKARRRSRSLQQIIAAL